MASLASTSMADSLDEKIRKCHNEMVIRLCDYFSPKLKDKWEVLLQRLTTYLKPVDLYADDNSFIKMCNRLMALEIIDCGSYDKLYEVIRKIDAEPAKIIKETSEEIKDIRSKELSEGVLPKTGERDQRKEFRRRITAMIGRTKAMIEEDKKSPFIATKGFQDAKEKLQRNRVVVIKGNSGDGKTTTAIRLILGMIEEQHGRQPIQLFNIDDLDSLPPKSKLITFIDDIFGKKVVHERDVGDWNERIKSVLSTLCGDPHTEANFLLITIRNEVFNSLKSHTLENVFVDSNIIDLSSNDYKIKGEMLELLESYKPENVEFSWEKNEKDEIINYATGIGFPQCCRIFRDCSELHKERVKFFKMPFHFLNRVLEKLAECNAILFLFLNGGEINVKDLDPNGNKVDKTLLGEAFDIDLKDVVENRSAWNDKKKIEFVRKSLDTLSGFLVVKEKLWYRVGFVYKFAHDSIYSTVERLYRQITPTGFIRHCPTRSLSLFTISKSALGGILLTPDNYVYMFERILRAWDSKRHYSHGFVCFLDVWTDGQFIEIFFRWLNDNDIDKVDVLNKACYCGVKPFVLYLLSRDVKPNKDTNWWSLMVAGQWGHDVDMDTLQKVIKYMTDEMKLDLFNKACSKGFVVCALYFLSDGVKTDKDTDWWSLLISCLGSDKDTLQKVIKCMNDEMKLHLLNKACSEGVLSCASYLLFEGVKSDKDTDWWSLFRNYWWRDKDKNTLQKVIKYMNDEDQLDLFNKACSECEVECVLYLLSEGVKPNKDTNWWSLFTRDLRYIEGIQRKVYMFTLQRVIKYMNDEMKLDLLNKACSEGGVEIVLWLLSEGVKPDKDTDWWSLVTRYRGCDVEMDILKKVIIYMNDEMKLYLLNKACCSSSDECVKYLLSGDVECEENTPFCVVKTENIDMLRNIVYDINDETKLSLLNVTCYKGLEECALYLLSKGAKPDNYTPFCVVWRGCIKVMCKLVKYDVIPTVRSKKSKSSNKYVSMRHVSNINVLHEACLFEREEMVTLLCNAYPELVHDTDAFGHSPLLLAALTGNCGIFHTMETFILKTLYRVEDEQHQCESVDGRVVHRNCVCAQYMSQVFDLYGGTILNVICERGHIELCIYICQSYPELATVEIKYGKTVLHSSCFGRNGEICKYLCQLYPGLTAVVDSYGRHFLHDMARCISYVSLFSECEILVKQYLDSTENIYDITTILDNNGRTVLHESCESGNMDLCVYLCQTYPELTTAVDKDGRTVLHVSCERGDRDICKYLCETFPKLTTAVDKDGMTVVHVSCANRHKDLCVYLCQTYPELTTAVDEDGRTALHVSCERRDREICKYLCETFPELSTAVDKDGRTALHVSCERRDREICKYLCETFPELTTAVDKDGRTVLHVSCKSGARDICKYLCETFPDLTTAVDKDGRTVLHVSCERGDREICTYLCETFPEITTAVDKDGGHCLHYLAKYNWMDVDMFTECQVYVKRYLESLGKKYDIKTILNNRGQSVLDVAKDGWRINRHFYRYLLQLFNDEVQVE